jgi:hypothetical protein
MLLRSHFYYVNCDVRLCFVFKFFTLKCTNRNITNCLNPDPRAYNVAESKGLTWPSPYNWVKLNSGLDFYNFLLENSLTWKINY